MLFVLIGCIVYCAFIDMDTIDIINQFGMEAAKFFDFGGTQAYALNGANNFILVFRGTEPTQWQDIKADLDIKKVQSKSIDGKLEGKVHRGFKYALNDVWEDVVKYMKECETDKKQIYITGHSLGAALATLVAGRLNNPDVVLYTFGSPRVGNGCLLYTSPSPRD